MRSRFPALDGLRALAALAILASNVGLSLNSPLLARLDAGVAVFFAISGFLLYRPHAVAWFEGTLPPLTLPYLRNRALRILPVLCVAVLLTLVLVPDWRSPVWSRQLWIAATAGTFYILLPALAKLLTAYERPTRRSVRWRLAVLGVFTLLGPAWMAVTATNHPQAGLWLPGYVGWFAVGMGFALWQVARASGRLAPSALDTLAKIPGTLWGIAAALLLIAATPLAGPYDLSASTPGQAFVKSLLYTGIAACVLFPAVQTGGVLGGTVARVGGKLAYGVFAYHLIVLSVIERLTGQFAVRLVGTLVVSVALAGASYYWMERPILRRGAKTASPSTASKASSPSSNPAR
ncbi:acyltransferase [Kribbella sp. NPDC051952]|uniref:acyltransferase family protein n=1 Tax=Kribbella sp. NPDC051952 TaxID=3154851 RepID=UPI0034496995